MKAKDLIKILNKEKTAEILIDGQAVSGFRITYACNEKGEWVIDFIPIDNNNEETKKY